ncbi:hypothetical protein [Acidovorax kalamii]|uniref:Uncharacterized protein n=1 Tax=Acidovorax kalamii TaxID=2004485 RepID=A0A235ENP4_9BURK|nr:hypothetical protein [Acidovorax kalamii]OYD50668.1 hypothetical protein CBY09_08005 [Acidovorax kalamii]
MTNQQGAPEALRTITRYEVVDCIDSKHVPAVIPNKDGPWVRYEDHLAALVEAQQPAPSAAAGMDELLAIAKRLAVATDEGDDQAQGTHYVDKQGLIRCKGSFLSLIEDARAVICSAAPQPSPTPQADSRPAPVLGYPQLPEPQYQMGGKGHSDAAMRAYVDADRAARAPADSVTAPAGGVVDGWKLAPKEPTLHMGWAYLDAAKESDPLRTHTFNHAGYRAMLAAATTPPAQAADSVLEDAARLKEAVGLLEELAEHDNYSTEYDGRMLYICPECGEQDGEHRANCAFVRAKAFLAARKQGGV